MSTYEVAEKIIAVVTKFQGHSPLRGCGTDPRVELVDQIDDLLFDFWAEAFDEGFDLGADYAEDWTEYGIEDDNT